MKKEKAEGRVPKFLKGAEPGATLKREYHDKEFVVKVLKDGFHYGGKLYTSLSTIACLITKMSTNGPLWFGLVQRPDAAKPKAKANKAGRKAKAGRKVQAKEPLGATA